MTTAIDRMWQLLLNIAYRLHVCYCFFRRPTHHGVYVALWHGERILLIKNSYRRCHTLPGGSCKRGEDPAATASRELLEEIGYSISPEALTFVETHFSRFEFTKDYIDLFEVRLDEEPSLRVDNREVVRAEFMSVGDALTLRLFPTVKDYLEGLGS